MIRPATSLWPLAAALLALIAGQGALAQGFQSGSSAAPAPAPAAAAPMPAQPASPPAFESVGTSSVAPPAVATGVPVAVPVSVPAPVPATEPAAPPVTAPVPVQEAAPFVTAPMPAPPASPPAFGSVGTPAVAPAAAATVPVTAPMPAQVAVAAARPFSSVSAPVSGQSASGGGAGPLLPVPDAATRSSFELADRIVVEKGARRLYLLRGDDVIVEYPVRLGLNPYGHKQREGDFRTPEGTYYLSRRNPRSEFFLSVEVSYPNENDRARARQAGVRPGGLIMIHGQPNVPRKTPDYYASNDWTDGCIAVSNSDMVDIWQRTTLGIPIEIRP